MTAIIFVFGVAVAVILAMTTSIFLTMKRIVQVIDHIAASKPVDDVVAGKTVSWWMRKMDEKEAAYRRKCEEL